MESTVETGLSVMASAMADAMASAMAIERRTGCAQQVQATRARCEAPGSVPGSATPSIVCSRREGGGWLYGAASRSENAFFLDRSCVSLAIAWILKIL